MFKAQKGSKDIGKIAHKIASWYSPERVRRIDEMKSLFLFSLHSKSILVAS